MRITFTFFDSIIGRIFIASTDKGILRVSIDGDIDALKRELEDTCNTIILKDDCVLKPVVSGLKEYLKGIPVIFRCRLDLKGTQFERQVWGELLKTPFGKTVSYKEIAERIDMPGAARAVGNACARNPIPIIIPCHRVISSSGALGGYSSGIHIKKRLLAIERNPLVYETHMPTSRHKG